MQRRLLLLMYVLMLYYRCTCRNRFKSKTTVHGSRVLVLCSGRTRLLNFLNGRGALRYLLIRLRIAAYRVPYNKSHIQMREYSSLPKITHPLRRSILCNPTADTCETATAPRPHAYVYKKKLKKERKNIILIIRVWDFMRKKTLRYAHTYALENS